MCNVCVLYIRRSSYTRKVKKRKNEPRIKGNCETRAAAAPERNKKRRACGVVYLPFSGASPSRHIPSEQSHLRAFASEVFFFWFAFFSPMAKQVLEGALSHIYREAPLSLSLARSLWARRFFDAQAPRGMNGGGCTPRQRSHFTINTDQIHFKTHYSLSGAP